MEYPNNSSLLNLLAEQVLPAALAAANPERAKLPHISVIDTGNQRFDVYAGPFTRNDQYAVSPYTNVIVYMSVPAGIAKQIPGQLNGGTSSKKRSEEEERNLVVSARIWLCLYWFDHQCVQNFFLPPFTPSLLSPPLSFP